MPIIPKVEAPLFLLLSVVALVHPQDECDVTSCHPQLGDLMVGRNSQLSATSTCGLNGPQTYCIIGHLEDEQKCFTCDSRYPYNLYSNPNSHQIENAITTFEPERKMKWWQSENGVHEVSVRLDLETLFQFSHLVLTFKSFRPLAMLVERSKDNGRTWKVFRYFAEDCKASFPRISEGPADSVDDVICDSKYSAPEPSTDGEVVLKALDPNFHIEDPYAPDIQELITITNLRVNFTRLFTLGDTLLGRRRRNPQDKYYYALYEMVVRGNCFCNGHASQCMPVDSGRGDVFSEPGMVHGRCVCHHNTMGTNCERCQDFYHDAPWRPAGKTATNACRRCNCNGHSDRCHFDMAVYLASGQVSGGVCDDCRNNRIGIHCEECSPFFYQDPRLPPEHPNACVPCDCDPNGSLSGGLCDPRTGRCVCKSHVEGDRCDRCKYGFYGLRQDDPAGCQACNCNPLGTVQTPYPCDQATGACFCRRLATGPYCDQCVPGYWGLGNTVYSCSPCDCDIGGAYNSMCSSADGQCQCLPNMVGRTCSEPAPGHFLAPLDYYLYDAERAIPLERRASSLLYPTPEAPPRCDEYFKQRGYDFKYRNGNFVLVKRAKRRARRRRQSIPVEPGSAHQIIPRERTADRLVTWTGPGFVRVQDGAGLRFNVNNLPVSLDYALVIRFEPETTDDWAAVIKIVPAGSPGDGVCPNNLTETNTLFLSGSDRMALLSTFACLNRGGEYHVDIVFERRTNNDPQPTDYILIDSMGLVPKIDSLQNFCSDHQLDEFRRYRCVEIALEVGLQVLPEVCERLISSMSARIHNGAVPCRCNPVGALSPSCSKFGGQCHCKPNVIGRCCDTCAPQTFGFGPNGCTPCDCDPRGSMEPLCDQGSGQCPCWQEMTGRRCDQCLPGYFGFPQCQPCQCNGLADLCDPVTGECLNCRDHSTGPNCERCVEGYFGDPVFREPCEPCLCPDSKESGRYFAWSCSKYPESERVICECEQGHTGARCDVCSPGFYGNLALPGARCEECPCNNNIDPRDGDACDSLTGECLRCLHNTQGPRCQSCKSGYYGDALAQDCKACSCDPRGTEITRCPVGSPCLCDQVTGQCTCRPGVIGALCDECDDGFWNLGGVAGCQPCDCDPANSLSNQCDKVTGQCPCRTEYGGRQCDECGENYFGNPDLQCISCDCNMEGTARPACDTDTGECLCRPEVTGIFCDECAPGRDSRFPECAPCHDCALLWAKNVTDVQRAAARMKELIPNRTHDLEPGYARLLQWIEKKLSELGWLVNATSLSLPELMKAERLCESISMLKDSIDPNIIIIDKSPLLNTEIDNIRYDFNKLLAKLIDYTKQKPQYNEDTKTALKAMEEIRKHHAKDKESEQRVKDAKAMLDSSKAKRQEAKERLDSCPKKDWNNLEKKIKSLSVAGLNEDICGAPGDANCSQAECGGALCRDALGARECGGPTCKGSLPVSQNASEIAEQADRDIQALLNSLRDSAQKISEVKQMTQDTKDEAEELMKKISDSKEKYEKEKNTTKDLIQRVKDYLRDELVKPEDIDKVAAAVLAIQLPGSPAEIQDMIRKIQNILVNCTDLHEDLNKLQDQVKTAQDLLKRAKEVQNKTKAIDVSEIKKAMADAEEAQSKVSKDLEQAKKNTDAVDQQLKAIEDKLSNTEINLDPQRIKDLLEGTEALKNKTEVNRRQAEEAKAAADKAQDAAKGLDKVMRARVKPPIIK
ncbi:laminin subunit beta-4 [Megalops cyprinoides]|uniref:laminin subunit beta-4 n=1 Tax=Megalops cyprinoides TaxID=118141 RepID=UPI001864E78F|nr:laminin subunit beta-4 [Megalops cyprinoides]